MKHAGPAALDQLEPLLVQVRALEAFVERTRGSFYRKGKGMLHFHEDPAGLFADIKVDGEFARMRVSTRAERAALLRVVKQVAAEDPPRLNARSALRSRGPRAR